MKIHFKDHETFRDIEIDTEKYDRFFEQEHNERRRTKENPSGFTPSIAFNQMSQTFNADRKKHTEHLDSKLKNNQPITENDIHAARVLEILALKTSFDPKGDHCKGRIRDINNGKDGIAAGSKPVWKNMEIRAKHAGLLEGSSSRSRVSVSIAHNGL